MRSVSTWSLHRTLGQFVAPDSAALDGSVMDGAASANGLALLDLPRELREHGYTSVQICHFHLHSRSSAYLRQLRDALADAEIEFEALLIDAGDFTDPATADRVEAWVGEWLDVAVALGAARARVMAGRAEPTPDKIQQYAERLLRLAAAHPQVRIVVENWSGLLSNANAVNAVLRETGDTVGLLVDLGNWRGPSKYAELAKIAPSAETCHAKCAFDDREPDRDDFRRSLQILKDAGYSGPLALIYDGADDNEWAQLDVEYELVRSVFTQAG